MPRHEPRRSLEPMTGIEPVTSPLPRECSTNRATSAKISHQQSAVNSQQKHWCRDAFALVCFTSITVMHQVLATHPRLDRKHCKDGDRYQPYPLIADRGPCQNS